MKRQSFWIVWMILAWSVAAVAVPGVLIADDKTADSVDGKAGGLQQRIDFGNAHIMGQSIKSGAVYLMHRKKSDIDSMLKVRQDYRAEIKEEYRLKNTALDTNAKQTDQKGKIRKWTKVHSVQVRNQAEKQKTKCLKQIRK
jgi:microcompartment protein CcmL/EutN